MKPPFSCLERVGEFCELSSNFLPSVCFPTFFLPLSYSKMSSVAAVAAPAPLRFLTQSRSYINEIRRRQRRDSYDAHDFYDRCAEDDAASDYSDEEEHAECFPDDEPTPAPNYNDKQGGFSILSRHYNIEFGWTLPEAKLEAVRRSCEFGQLPIAEMVRYLARGCHPAIWRAIIVLAPHVKVQKAVVHAKYIYDAAKSVESIPFCRCDECQAWWASSSSHHLAGCADPHCCIKGS